MMHGAHLRHDGTCTFKVWSPLTESLILHIVYPSELRVDMVKDDLGYFKITLESVSAGTRYYFNLKGQDLPDPASFFQSQGIFGPSEVIDQHSFKWEDAAWKGVAKEALLLYEIHVGTFTDEGTFEGVISRLDDLCELGINALELMPVAQFPGSRNWGYDGVFPFAVQHTYGGPQGLKKLVNACHKKGIAVFLDVVYNHIGPEGSCLDKFGPYFTPAYQTPWGDAVNFDGPWSDGVREYVTDNVAYWLNDFHIDGLRFDAIHCIYDKGAKSIWKIINQRKTRLEQHTGRNYIFIAESDLNDPRVIMPTEKSGHGFNAQWLDDFHHSVYAMVDSSGKGYYEDFGSLAQIVKALKEGFVHSGGYVKVRKRKFGASSRGISGDHFVVFNQNHDQIGNRPDGKRVSDLVVPELTKTVAALLFLSPYIPLLFMGEEYADPAPFFYFVSHSDPELIRQVRAGRKQEFSAFHTDSQFPDPQSADTFKRSVLSWNLRQVGEHKKLHNWYRALILLRKSHPALGTYDKEYLNAWTIQDQGIALFRTDVSETKAVFALFNFSAAPFVTTLPGQMDWIVHLSADETFPAGMRVVAHINIDAGAVIICTGKRY